MIKAVLFDLDGTLVNSLEDLADSTNFALSKFGYPIHNTEAYKYFVGDGIPKLIERAVPETARNVSDTAKVYEAFIEHYGVHFSDKTAAYDGVEQVLSRLKSDGIKTAVVSNKAQNMALAVAEKVFTHHFDTVFGKRDGIPPKPDPTSLAKTMKTLGCAVNECIFVGDSGMDAAAAKNAGCISVGVLWGFRTESELKENGADYIIGEPWDIVKILEELNG